MVEEVDDMLCFWPMELSQLEKLVVINSYVVNSFCQSRTNRYQLLSIGALGKGSQENVQLVLGGALLRLSIC